MDAVRKAPELNYMTQIVFMLFEDVRKPENSMDKFHVDIHFSPGIKGRRELIFDGSSVLLMKSSPELSEKSPQVFVKRLLHSTTAVSSEGATKKMRKGSDVCTNSQKKTSGGVATVGGGVRRSDGSRYVTGSRSVANKLSLMGTVLSRRVSAPNVHEPLRSSSDTRLTDKMTEKVNEKQSPSQRKKSASDSVLESFQDIIFRIGGSSQQSKSDGDVNEDESPQLRPNKLACSSPVLNRTRDKPLSPCDKPQSLSSQESKVSSVSAPSMSHRYVTKPSDSIPSSSRRKPVSPRKKHSLPLLISPKEEHSLSLATTTISENEDTTNKWGSLEQLQNESTGELGLDSQQSMVERGKQL